VAAHSFTGQQLS
jgi:Ca2+-binding RTX toxin-like protein